MARPPSPISFYTRPLICQLQPSHYSPLFPIVPPLHGSIPFFDPHLTTHLTFPLHSHLEPLEPFPSHSFSVVAHLPCCLGPTHLCCALHCPDFPSVIGLVHACLALGSWNHNLHEKVIHFPFVDWVGGWVGCGGQTGQVWRTGPHTFVTSASLPHSLTPTFVVCRPFAHAGPPLLTIIPLLTPPLSPILFPY